MMTTQDASMPPAGAGEDEGAADAATTANLNAGFAKVRGADAPDGGTGADPAGPGGGGGGGADVSSASSGPGAPGAVGGAPVSPGGALGTAVPELSTEQMRDLLAKVPDMERAHAATAAQLRQAFGKIGALQQTLQALQPKAADSQGTRRIKAEALKRLSAQYGPELADALSHDLSEALGSLPPSHDDGRPSVDAQGMTADQRMEARLLTRDHPDWKVLPGTTDFRLWMAGLPAAVQREFEHTWDADYLSRVFSSYKAQRAAAVHRRGQHQARLDRAVPAPSGGAARQAVMPDAAGLQAGFNRVRGAR